MTIKSKRKPAKAEVVRKNPQPRVGQLVDRYGQIHSESVLRDWSPQALKALGIHRVGDEEVPSTGFGASRAEAADAKYSAKQRRMRGRGKQPSSRPFVRLYWNVIDFNKFAMLDVYGTASLLHLTRKYNGCNNGLIPMGVP